MLTPNIETFILSKLLHRSTPNFANDRDHQVFSVGGLNMPPSNSNMADGRYHKKSQYRNISAVCNRWADLDKIWHNEVPLPYSCSSANKFCDLKNQDGASRHRKIAKKIAKNRDISTNRLDQLGRIFVC